MNTKEEDYLEGVEEDGLWAMLLEVAHGISVFTKTFNRGVLNLGHGRFKPFFSGSDGIRCHEDIWPTTDERTNRDGDTDGEEDHTTVEEEDGGGVDSDSSEETIGGEEVEDTEIQEGFEGGEQVVDGVGPSNVDEGEQGQGLEHCHEELKNGSNLA